MLTSKTKGRLISVMAKKAEALELISKINSAAPLSLKCAQRLKAAFGHPAAEEIKTIVESGSGTLSAKAKAHMISQMARKDAAVELAAAIEAHSA